jgi:hypothetical protein
MTACYQLLQVLADANSAVSASWTTTYTRLAPYLGTPKFAIATFILQQYSTKQTLIVSHQHGGFYYKNSREGAAAAVSARQEQQLQEQRSIGARKHDVPALAGNWMNNLQTCRLAASQDSSYASAGRPKQEPSPSPEPTLTPASSTSKDAQASCTRHDINKQAATDRSCILAGKIRNGRGADVF